MVRRASVPGLTTGSQEVCGRYGAHPSVTDGAATEALGSATAASAPATGPAASPPVSPPVSTATATIVPRPRRPLPRPAPPYRTLCSRPRRWPVTPVRDHARPSQQPPEPHLSHIWEKLGRSAVRRLALRPASPLSHLAQAAAVPRAAPPSPPS